MTSFKRFLASDSGEVSIEYALIGAVLGTSLIAVLVEIAPYLQGTFTDVVNGLKSVPH